MSEVMTRQIYDGRDRQFSVTMAGGRAIVDCSGGATIKINVRGEMIPFQFSERLGPIPIKLNGDVRHLPHSHPFWRIASIWVLQGMFVSDGIAVWHEPRKPVLLH